MHDVPGFLDFRTIHKVVHLSIFILIRIVACGLPVGVLYSYCPCTNMHVF